MSFWDHDSTNSSVTSVLPCHLSGYLHAPVLLQGSFLSTCQGDNRQHRWREPCPQRLLSQPGEGGAPTITMTNRDLHGVRKHAKCCKEPLEQLGATRDDAGGWSAMTSESRVRAGLTQRVAFERKLEEVKTGVQRILGEGAASAQTLG